MSHRKISITCIMILMALIAFPSTAKGDSDSDDSTTGTGTISIFLPQVSTAATNSEEWIGPSGGRVISLGISESNPDIIYAGTWGAGVFVSQDGGVTWDSASKGIDTQYIQSLAVDPKNPLVVYAGTYKDDIFKTTDGGLTWAVAGTGIQDEAVTYAIAINPSDTNIVYASTRGVSNDGSYPFNGIIYKSTDAGATWTESLNDVGDDYEDWAYSISIYPSDPDWIYAATHQHGPWRTTDGGDNWSKISSGASYLGRGISVARTSTSTDALTVYMSSWNTSDVDTRGGVFKTEDSGAKWHDKMSGVYGYDIYTLLVDPTNADNVYLGTHTDGMMKTTDGGDTWVTIHNGFKIDELIYALASDISDSNTYYAGTSYDGLYKTTDGGTTWAESDDGLSGSPVTSVVVRPDNPDLIIASLYQGGIFYSTDGGDSWIDITGDLYDNGIHGLAVSPTNNEIVYALTDDSGVMKMDLSNYTSGWSETSGLQATVSKTLEDTYSPTFPTDHPFANQSISEDDWIEAQETAGDTVTKALDGYDSSLCLTFAPSNGLIGYLGTTEEGLYKTTDGGSSFFKTGLKEVSIYSVAVDPNDANILYAATDDDDESTLKVSTDGGSKWSNTDLPVGVNAYAVAFSDDDSSVAYAGTSNGLYKLDTDGSWEYMSMGGVTIDALMVNPTSSTTVYMGTEDGVFTTTDGGVHYTQFSTESDGFTVQSMAIGLNSDLSGYRYFFGTQTHGILKVGD